MSQGDDHQLEESKTHPKANIQNATNQHLAQVKINKVQHLAALSPRTIQVRNPLESLIDNTATILTTADIQSRRGHQRDRVNGARYQKARAQAAIVLEHGIGCLEVA
jgi:hypothetical protein